MQAPPLWLVASFATVSLAAAGGAIAIGAPLFEDTPRDSPPTTGAPDDPIAAIAPPATSTTAAAPATPTPTPPAAPPAPAAPPSARLACRTTAVVHFEHGNANLPGDWEAVLAPIVERAAALPSAAITVDGHADPTGDEYRNLVLSKARAHRVAVALGTRIANPITERAFGAYVPTTGQDTTLRRVQVTLLDPHCTDEAEP